MKGIIYKGEHDCKEPLMMHEKRILTLTCVHCNYNKEIVAEKDIEKEEDLGKEF